MSKSLKKIVEESREKNQPEVDMCDRGISNMLDVPGLCRYRRRRAGRARKLPYLSRTSRGRSRAWARRGRADPLPVAASVVLELPEPFLSGAVLGLWASGARAEIRGQGNRSARCCHQPRSQP